jgi:hypothetical protein
VTARNTRPPETKVGHLHDKIMFPCEPFSNDSRAVKVRIHAFDERRPSVSRTDRLIPRDRDPVFTVQEAGEASLRTLPLIVCIQLPAVCLLDKVCCEFP